MLPARQVRVQRAVLAVIRSDGLLLPDHYVVVAWQPQGSLELFRGDW